MRIITFTILTPIFILLLVIIFHAIRSASMFNGMSSFILAVCVSILAIIGMAGYMNNSLDVILLPYATMAIAILLVLVLLIPVIGKYFKNAKDHSSCKARKNTTSKYDIKKRKG